MSIIICFWTWWTDWACVTSQKRKRRQGDTTGQSMGTQRIRWNIDRPLNSSSVLFYQPSACVGFYRWEIFRWFLHTLPCAKRLMSTPCIRTHRVSCSGTWACAPWTWPSGKWVTSTLPWSRDSERRCEFRAMGLLFLFAWRIAHPKGKWHLWGRGGSFSLGSGWQATWSGTQAGAGHSLPAGVEWADPLLKADSTAEGRTTAESALHSQKVFIFTFKMTLAGRHSQSTLNTDADKECISKVTNCIHGDKNLRKTVVLFSPVPKATWLNVKINSSYCVPRGIAFPPQVTENGHCQRLFPGMIILIREEERGAAWWASPDVSDQSTEQGKQRKQKRRLPAETACSSVGLRHGTQGHVTGMFLRGHSWDRERASQVWNIMEHLRIHTIKYWY